jgi:hypothetical protein
VFTPHELIEKLVPLIPHPRRHLVRYHGILGLAAKERDKRRLAFLVAYISTMMTAD